MLTHEIVVLGGGVAGTLVANLLSRRLTRKRARVTLIDRTGRHVYQPGLLYIPFGGAQPEQFERSERGLLDRGVRLVLGDVRRINRDEQAIEMVDGAAFPYDTLVIATGARLAPEVLPGYAEGAHHFYTPEQALRLHAALRDFDGGRILVGAADLPYKCPPAPLEFAFLLDDELRRRGLRDRATITYLSPAERVFPIENVAAFVEPLLAEREIDTRVDFVTASVDPAARTVTSARGATLGYDLLILVPPHRGAQAVVDAGLGDKHGWVPADRETLQALADPRIYVIGDANDLPVSKTGSAAHFEAKVVAHRIIAGLIGQHDDARYTGEVLCFLETGRGQASQFAFDYTHAPQPPRPSQLYHYEKTLFNKAYWYLVPKGIV